MTMFILRLTLILSTAASGICSEPLDTPAANFSSNDIIWQFIWPRSTICSTGCNLENVAINASQANIIKGWNNSGCKECVFWGGTGQLSPFTAALLALGSFGGAEYCYSGFWMLCGIKGGIFLFVFCGAIIYRLQDVRYEAVEEDATKGQCRSRGGVLLHAFLLLFVMALLAWDIVNMMAILDLFGGDSEWTFGREACGKPFLNPTSALGSLTTRPFGVSWFVDDMKHCKAGSTENPTENGMCCEIEYTSR